jgi:hypothetical protein
MKNEINPNYEKLTLNEKKIVDLVTSFCHEKLDEEYIDLCSDLMEEYDAVEENVFHRGKPEIWASAIIYAIGSINFLFDKNTEPYVSIDDITNYFGTKKSTITNKGRVIKDDLDIFIFDPDFSREEILENNSFDKYEIVNGFIVPKEKPLNLSDKKNDKEPEKIEEKIVKEEQKKVENKKLNFGLFEGMGF